MKIVLFILVCFSSIYGQARDHEFSISVGLGTSAQLGLVFDELEHLGDEYDYRDTGNPHQFHFSYYYYSQDSNMYGLYFGYENYPQSIFTHSNNVGSLEKKNYTVAVEYGKRYFDLNWLQLFFNGGLGITYIDEMLSEKEPTNIKTKSKFVLAYHVNALGVRIGYIVYLNISVGYGYRGILNLGLSYQF